jgi:hypothetical protein
MKRQDGEVTVRILLAEQTEDVNSILSLNFVGETVRVGTVFNTLLYRYYIISWIAVVLN